MKIILIVGLAFIQSLLASEFIDPKDYYLYCHGEIEDAGTGKKVGKFSFSENPKNWPIKFDLANYPRLNEAIWFGPKVLETENFSIQYRTGRNVQWLEVKDNRKPHEYDKYMLARAGTNWSSGSYVEVALNSTMVGEKLSYIFARCQLVKK